MEFVDIEVKVRVGEVCWTDDPRPQICELMIEKLCEVPCTWYHVAGFAWDCVENPNDL